MYVLFCISFSLIALPCLVYPLIIYAGGLFTKQPEKTEYTFNNLVSYIIICYNEEKYIGKKLEEIFHFSNWVENSEVIVISNGSTDRTNEIIKQFAYRKELRVFQFEERIGKIASVNYAVSICKNEFLVFSDCRQKMSEGAVINLLNNFHLPDIGTVTSTLTDYTYDRSVFSFRKVINNISLAESNLGYCMNVYGALYAQRKSVFRDIPTRLLFDDLFVTVSTLLQDKKIIIERNACIFDIPFAEYYSHERIERLTRGLLLFISTEWSMIKKLKTHYLVAFLFHKYAKIFTPYLFLLLLISTSAFTGIRWTALIALFISLYYIGFRKKKSPFVLFLKININIVTSTFKFFVLNKRNNDWEKLKI